MAKLYFYYSAMNAGKSTTLLQSSYNYQERGMQTLLFTPNFDHRSPGKIWSRIGLEADAILYDEHTSLFDLTAQEMKQMAKLSCVLVDEAHFLTPDQVNQLTDVCDTLNIPVLAYGLRTDFQAKTFPGSQYLLAWADELIEIKTICYCGKKAMMNMRVDENNQPVKEGNQVEIGGNDRYIAMCRRHFKEEVFNSKADQNSDVVNDHA